jgi:peptidoglycan hydrolase-like protein with peptidoglycan-binding domain
MASNVGITLAQIRNGSAVYQLDATNPVDGVKAVQKALKLLGYYAVNTDTYDGKMGETTVAAVKGFQTENNLTLTGTVNKQTLALIDSKLLPIYSDGHILKPSVNAIRYGFDYAGRGCSGDGVNKIRSLLINKGYSVSSSGSFNDDLYEKVQAFQRANHLADDGSVGQRTFLALENSTSSTGWISSTGKVSLTAGLLAQCGFWGVLLNFYVPQLNTAINNLSTTYAPDLAAKKALAKHFLAQCMGETSNGSLLVEATYKAGIGGPARYSPFYGAGLLHLTFLENYEKFKKEKYPSDDKITNPPTYATQHVAIKYPGPSGSWFWNKFVSPKVTNWKGDSASICRTVTYEITGSYNDATKRHGHYTSLGEVLK